MSTIIAIHGVDGAGKTSLIEMLVRSRVLPNAAFIAKDNKANASNVQRYCPPADGASRNWINGSFAECVAVATAFDFLEHFRSRIAPQLDRAEYIVCDRYALCFAAYLHATGSPFPADKLFERVPLSDLSILIDVDHDLLTERYQRRGGASEDETLEVMTAFRASYKILGPRWTKKLISIENNGDISVTFAELQDAIAAHLKNGSSSHRPFEKA